MQKYLTAITRDRKFFAFATSEPTMGSDVSSLRCLAKPDGDDYILNVHFGQDAPGECPYCFFPATAFKKIEHP